MTPPIITISEAQAFVRIETGDEEAILAGLIRTASGLCEAFIGQLVIARDFQVDVSANASWERLPLTPVRSITQVDVIDQLGELQTLSAGAFAVDIDSSGDGWVRLIAPAEAMRVRVSGSAGIADDQNGVPESVRQGVIRLVTHLFASRDGSGGEMPAAVTALWRPYRRLRMG